LKSIKNVYKLYTIYIFFVQKFILVQPKKNPIPQFDFNFKIRMTC
jgi:hypothetical protein